MNPPLVALDYADDGDLELEYSEALLPHLVKGGDLEGLLFPLDGDPAHRFPEVLALLLDQGRTDLLNLAADPEGTVDRHILDLGRGRDTLAVGQGLPDLFDVVGHRVDGDVGP